MDARVRKVFLVLIQRWELVVGGVIAVAVPTVTAYTSYRDNLSSIRTEFVTLRLENEQKFVKKDEMADAVKILQDIRDKVNVMSGEMKAARRERLRAGY